MLSAFRCALGRQFSGLGEPWDIRRSTVRDAYLVIETKRDNEELYSCLPKFERILSQIQRRVTNRSDFRSYLSRFVA